MVKEIFYTLLSLIGIITLFGVGIILLVFFGPGLTYENRKKKIKQDLKKLKYLKQKVRSVQFQKNKKNKKR